MVFRLFLLLMLTPVAFAKAPDGGGTMPVPRHGNDRFFIEQALTRARVNAENVRKEKGMFILADPMPPVLQWPVRKAITVTDPDIQAISNFLDQDPSEGGIQDYN